MNTNPNPWQEEEEIAAVLATEDLSTEERKELEERLKNLKIIQASACSQVEKKKPPKRIIYQYPVTNPGDIIWAEFNKPIVSDKRIRDE